LTSISNEVGIAGDSVAAADTQACGNVIVAARWRDGGMTDMVDLLDRRLYAFGQVDYILGLSGGTAKRWIFRPGNGS
jgi:hypothetical protein